MSTAMLAAPARPSLVENPPPVGDLTPEELAWMDGPGREGRYEWVDGKAVKKPVSYDTNLVAANVVGELFGCLRRHPVAGLLIEQEYQCFPRKPKQVRKPDVSLILTSRMPVPHPRGYLRFPPDLAVECVSPNDKVYDLDGKLEDYRAAGFPLVWTVNPDSRLVRVHTLGEPVVERRVGQILDAPALLPGFSVRVEDLIPA